MVPTSWVTVVAFEGSIIAFGCCVAHATSRNLDETDEFVVTVLSAPLAGVQHVGGDT